MTEKRLIHEGDDGVAHRVVLTDVDGNPVNPGGGAAAGSDYELVVTTYRATSSGTGYSSGDTITATRAIEITDSEMAQVNSTLWFNETTGLALASAPTAAHLTVAGAPGLTDAQLRASAVAVLASGFAAIPSASFTRPADTTAYASGDLIANSTTAGSVAPVAISVARVAAGSFLINRVRLSKSGTGVTGASFRVHLFNTQPTVANGDNGALLTSGRAGYIGRVDFDMTAATIFNDGNAATADAGFLVALASGQTVWALIEARGAYAPASGETFSMTLEVAQN